MYPMKSKITDTDLPDTKPHHLRPCFRDFQMSIFNNQTTNVLQTTEQGLERRKVDCIGMIKIIMSMSMSTCTAQSDSMQENHRLVELGTEDGEGGLEWRARV